MKKLNLLLTMLMLMCFSVGTMWADDYELKAASNIESGDVVIITHDNGSLYAMSNGNGTSSAPSAVSVSATNNVISTTEESILWDVTVSSGSYVFRPHGSTTTALYCTSSNNGVRVGTNANNAFTIDGSSNYLVNSATNRYIGVYNSQDWRCYTSINANIKDQTLGFYVLKATPSTTPSISVKQNGSAITEIDFGTVVEDAEHEDYGYYAVQSLDVKGANLNGKVYLNITNGTLVFSICNPKLSSGSSFDLEIMPHEGAIDTTITVLAYTRTTTTGEKTGVLNVSSKASDFTAFDIDLKMNLIDRVDPTAVDLNKTELELEVGETETLVATVSPDNATNKKVLWQSSESTIADVDENGVVTAVGEGTCTIRCYAEENYYTYKSCEVTVIAHTVTAGTYTINLNRNLYGVAKGNNETEQSASQNDITIVSGCESYASNKTYYDDTHIRYYMDSYLKLSAPTGFVITEVVFTAGGTWNGYITVNAGEYDNDTKTWTGSAKEVDFSFASQNRIASIKVTYAAASEIALPNISGQTPFYPSTTVTLSIETDDCDIIYTMNGEDPLGGDNTYSQPIVLTETKTIKARGFKGVKFGDVVSKTFTKATPISVTDAIELIPNENDTKDDTFVYGYVCNLSTADPSNGQMTYYISKDGTETNRLQIYKGKGLNNADFSAISDIALGDKVVVYGQLKNYGGTYEMNSGNYIVERTAKGAVSSLDLTGTNTKTEFEYGDHFDPATDGSYSAKAVYENGYREDVTSLVTWDIDGKTLEQKEIQGSGTCALTATYSGKSDWVYINISKILKHKITFSAPENGTLEVTWLGSTVSSGDEYVKTYEFEVIATPAAGYELATLTANGVDIKDTKAFTMGSEDIEVVATFSKKAEGVLKLYNNGVVDFGAVKVGTTSVGTGVLRIDATKLTPNSDLEVSIDGTDDYFEIQVPSDGKIDVDENGEIDYFAINIAVTSTALATYGEKTATLRLHSNDLAADSLATIKLIVGGIVTTTPSPVALDLGDVLNNDEPTLYGKKFHVKVTNLSANKQARVVPSTASFSADPYYLVADGNGVIDCDVTILPYLNGGGAAVYNADLVVVCSGTREFKDIKVGTVTMNLLEAYKVIVPDISNGSLSWDGGTAPQAVRPGTTHTIAAVPASGYEGGTIKILKNSDDSDITESVLSGSTLTMPSYAIKVVVSGFKQSAKPALPMSWKYESYTLTYGVFKEPALYSSLNINDNLKSTYGDQIVITSSNTNVATYTSKYSEYQCYTVYNNIVGAGTTVFTAYFAGDDTYGETTVSYTLTVNKADAGLAWSADAATVKYGASNNVFPTLSNPNNLTVSFESAPNWNATIDSNGAITIVNVGEATISAKFAGNSNYNAQTVEYTLTIEKGIPGYEYQINGSKVEDVYVTYGAKDNVFPTLVKPENFGVNYQSSNTAVAAINSYGTIYLYKAGTTTIKACFWGTSQWEADTATFVLHVAKGTPKLEWNAQYTQIENDEVTVDIYDSADGRQLPHLNSDAPDGVVITSSNESVVKINETYNYPVLQYETGDAIVTASFAENDQYNAKSISYTVHAVDNIRYESNLQWRIGNEQVSSASVTLAGNDNVFPTLYNPRNVTPTYSSSNENVATISNGTITLVGAGTTTITASFDGNYSYKPSTATYTLTVNAVANISVGGVSSIDFGTVSKGASVDEQSFTLVGSNLTGNVKVTAATEGSTSVFVTNGFRPSNTYTPTDGAINASVVVIPYTTKAGDFNGTLTIESLTGDFETIEIPLHIYVKAYPSIVANPTSIDFGQVNKGSSWPSQTLTITGANLTASVDATALTTGGGSVFYIDGISYVRLTPEEGAINATVTISANMNLPAGEYNGSVKIESNAATADFQPISVNLHIVIAEEGTGIDQIEVEQQIRKEFRDGKLYILRGGKTYDAAGRLVK